MPSVPPVSLEELPSKGTVVATGVGSLRRVRRDERCGSGCVAERSELFGRLRIEFQSIRAGSLAFDESPELRA